MNGGTIISDDGIAISTHNPAMKTESTIIGGGIATSFAVPASLALLGGFRKEKLDRKIINNDELIKDDIYEKLLKMAEVPTKGRTRKEKTSTNKTRKI